MHSETCTYGQHQRMPCGDESMPYAARRGGLMEFVAFEEGSWTMVTFGLTYLAIRYYCKGAPHT